jgi:Sulfotransferase domain
VTGEASPAYLFYPHVPGRVKQALPHVKLVVLLRNPVDRAYSQYYHAIEHGFETLPFEEAVKGEVERTAVEREKILQDEHYESYAFQHQSYLSRGIYVEQLQTWMSLFNREQFLILKSEEFYADPAGSVKQVLAFLDLPLEELQMRKQDYKQYNNTTYPRMDAALRKRLIEYFEPHNAQLYDFLGMNFGWDK